MQCILCSYIAWWFCITVMCNEWMNNIELHLKTKKSRRNECQSMGFNDQNLQVFNCKIANTLFPLLWQLQQHKFFGGQCFLVENAMRKFFNSLMLGMCEFNFQMNFEYFMCVWLSHSLTYLRLLMSRPFVYYRHWTSVFTYAILVAYSIAFSLFDFIKYNTRSSSIQVCFENFSPFSLCVKCPSPANFQLNWHMAHTRYTYIWNVIQCNEQNADNSNVLFTFALGRLSTDDDNVCLTLIFEWTGHSI